MHSYLTRNVSQNPVTVGQFNPKHAIRQWLDYCSLNLNHFLLGHKSCSSGLRLLPDNGQYPLANFFNIPFTIYLN